MGKECDWVSPPEEFSLADREVHLWRSSLTLSASQRQFLEPLLSPDEQTRAARFQFPHHRHRFIAARGILRRILARYLNRAPETLQFSYGPRGKPALSSTTNSGLQFNVSHSQDLALYAVTIDHSIGVDLEQVRTIDHLPQLTQRFFAPSEHQHIVTLPSDQQATLFFRYWTCKEAYLKATGDGIGHLQELEISFTPTGVQCLRMPVAQRGQPWSLQEVAPGRGFAGAVAIAAPTYQLRTWQFDLSDHSIRYAAPDSL